MVWLSAEIGTRCPVFGCQDFGISLCKSRNNKTAVKMKVHQGKKLFTVNVSNPNYYGNQKLIKCLVSKLKVRFSDNFWLLQAILKTALTPIYPTHPLTRPFWTVQKQSCMYYLNKICPKLVFMKLVLNQSCIIIIKLVQNRSCFYF